MAVSKGMYDMMAKILYLGYTTGGQGRVRLYALVGVTFECAACC